MSIRPSRRTTIAAILVVGQRPPVAEPFFAAIILVADLVPQPIDGRPRGVRLAIEEGHLGFAQAQIVLFEREAREGGAGLAFEVLERVRPFFQQLFLVTTNSLTVDADHVPPLPRLGEVEMLRVDDLVRDQVADVLPELGDGRPGGVLDIFEHDQRRPVKLRIADDREKRLSGLA
ncbi:hypothetical protein VTN77DRAFT_6575 [Rasamsonia byssochlamydoides]|uniref:uncharacterized protein n=1 Tax=Rasamsonia byssochlamydoides TaxID=89139 RepID=UPI0037425937